MPSHVLSVAAQSQNARAVRHAGNEVSRRQLLAGTGAVALSTAATAAAAPGDDAHLFDLIRQFHDAQKAAELAGKEADALWQGVSSLDWTEEEMAAHRIQRQSHHAKGPRRITLDDIDLNDQWDSPQCPKTTHESTDDGVTMVFVVTTRRPTATDEEIDAWKKRCAARRALYDAKWAAMRAAEKRLGVDAAEDRANAMWDEVSRLRTLIETTAATTVAGALAKLKTCKAACPDEDIASSDLFISVLADLERLVGGAA